MATAEAEVKPKFGLTELKVSDDLDIALDNEVYQDQTNPAPPPKGNYRFKALTLEVRKTKTGEQVTEAGGYPIFVLGMAEIVEGLTDAAGQPTTRKVGLFADIKTKPYLRQGQPASGVQDLTRAYGTANWRGLDPNDPNSGISRLQEAFETNQTFIAALDWEVYDKDFVAAAFEQLDVPTDKNIRTDDQKKLAGAIYNAARVKGQQLFPYDEHTGKFSGTLNREDVSFRNPVTNAVVTVEVPFRQLEARATLVRYYSAESQTGAKSARLGPANVKPAAAVSGSTVTR